MHYLLDNPNDSVYIIDNMKNKPNIGGNKMKDDRMNENKTWQHKRIDEIEEQIDNTRTWVYESFDAWDERLLNYVSNRFFENMMRFKEIKV